MSVGQDRYSAESKYKDWNQISSNNLILNWTFGVLSILASLAVSSGLLDDLDKTKIFARIVSFLAAICTALLAFFKPKEMNSGYRRAWRLLDKAFRDAQTEQDETKKRKILNEAVEAGEKIISSVDN